MVSTFLAQQLEWLHSHLGRQPGTLSAYPYHASRLQPETSTRDFSTGIQDKENTIDESTCNRRTWMEGSYSDHEEHPAT